MKSRYVTYGMIWLIILTGIFYLIAWTSGPEKNDASILPPAPDFSYPWLDSLLDSAVSQRAIPGAVLSVSREGETVYEKAFGYAKLYNYRKVPADPPEMMTTHHRFDLASLTKVFATTFGIMWLYDQKKLSLDVPVYTYLPGFRGVSKDSITLRHLLTHTGGLNEWKPVYYHARSPRESRHYITQLPLKYPVGKDRHYSDLGFMLLGYIIEEISGQSLDQFIQKNIYRPLGLQNTSFNPDPAGPPFAATSHGNPFEKKMVFDPDFGFVCDEDPETFTDWRKTVLVGEVNDGNSFYAHQGIAGHAGLFSTAQELKILLELLLNEGEYAGQHFLTRETVRLFLTKDKFGHGLGWAMSAPTIPVDNLPEGSFGHTGFTGTFAVAIPEYHLSILLLTNRQNLDVNPDGNYNSLTNLRKKVTESLIRKVAGN